MASSRPADQAASQPANGGAPGPLHGGALIFGSVALSLATFMNVLDLSIANVSIPAISGDLAAVDRLAYAALRTSPAVHGLGAAVRHRLVSVRTRAVDRAADPVSGHSGRGRRPDDSAIAIAAVIELSEREGGHGARAMGDDYARRAGRRAGGRRLDHRQYFVARDFFR